MDDAVFLYRRWMLETKQRKSNDNDLVLFLVNREILNEQAWVTAEKYFTLHKDILIRKYRQLVTTDDDGKKDFSGWNREVRYFVENIIPLECLEVNRVYIIDNLSEFRELLAENVTNLVIDPYYEDDSDDDFAGKDPIDYEFWCAEQLKNAG